MLSSELGRVDRETAARMFGAVKSFDDPAEEFERILRRVFESALRPGDGAVDVGAHVGKHTIPLALAVQSTGWVAAIEPLPWAIQRLEERAALGGVSDIVEAFHGCAGTALADNIEFDEVADHPGWSAKNVRSGTPGLIRHLIEQTTVDRLAQGREVRVIKIDVEGGEFDVVRGAAETIDRSRPVIHAEVVLSAIETNGWVAADLFHLFESHGYLVFDLLGNELLGDDLWRGYVESEPGPIEHYRGFDVVAIHRDDPDLMSLVDCLCASFGEERLDLSRHEVPELVTTFPVESYRQVPSAGLAEDQPFSFCDSLLAPPARAAQSVWPKGTNLVDSHVLEWPGNEPVLVDFNVGRTTSLGDGGEINLPIGAGDLDLSSAGEVRFTVAGDFEHKKERHQTFCELWLHQGIAAGVVRWHKSGNLDCMWVQNGHVVSIDRTPVTSLEQIEVLIQRSDQVWQISATSADFSLSSTLRVAVRSMTSPTLTIGRRSNWWPQEPLDAKTVVIATGQHPTLTARSVAKSVAHRTPGGMKLVRLVRRVLR